jgi:hypothetical protein
MSNFRWFASFVLAATVLRALPAEPHCPGNVASVPLHLTSSHQMIVAVSVNHSGPHNFLLDTGTQITMIDPSLAVELHLETQGKTEVVGVGFRSIASLAELDSMEAGSQAGGKLLVVVMALEHLQSSGLHIRGILGEDLLARFDVLIDNAHNLLCLDNTKTLQAAVKGEHIALVTPAPTAGGAPLAKSLILAARLSDGTRPLLLMLDSGTNVPLLYNPFDYLATGQRENVLLQASGADGTSRTFIPLPVQDVHIGSVELHRVCFITLAGSGHDPDTRAFDGLLATALFRQVFISYTNRFAVLQPW